MGNSDQREHNTVLTSLTTSNNMSKTELTQPPIRKHATFSKLNTSEAQKICKNRAHHNVTFSKLPNRVEFTYSAEDYTRLDEFCDPAGAAAQYELEKLIDVMDIFPVELLKQAPKGAPPSKAELGLSVIGMGVAGASRGTKISIFIISIIRGKPAQLEGKIKIYDQIVEVDDNSLVGVTYEYAQWVLQHIKGNVRLRIGRDKDPTKSEVARLLKIQRRKMMQGLQKNSNNTEDDDDELFSLTTQSFAV